MHGGMRAVVQRAVAKGWPTHRPSEDRPVLRGGETDRAASQ